jgi:hypothetical protein
MEIAIYVHAGEAKPNVLVTIKTIIYPWTLSYSDDEKMKEISINNSMFEAYKIKSKIIIESPKSDDDELHSDFENTVIST